MIWRLGRLTPALGWVHPRWWLPAAAAVAGLGGLLVVAPGSVLAVPDLAAVVHVLSAGMWAGGIIALASLQPPGGWRGAEARDLVERFGRIAAIAFVVTALTGVLRATDRLHEVTDLWTTAYGAVLLIKCVGVAAMLVISLAWRRGSRLALPDAAESRVALLDAGVTLGVVGATAVLAAFPVQA